MFIERHPKRFALRQEGNVSGEYHYAMIHMGEPLRDDPHGPPDGGNNRLIVQLTLFDVRRLSHAPVLRDHWE